MAFLTSRPEGTKEREVEIPLDAKQDRSYRAVVRLAVTNVLADLMSGMSRHTYFVYETQGETGEAVHIHGLDKTAQTHQLNLKEIALEAVALV